MRVLLALLLALAMPALPVEIARAEPLAPEAVLSVGTTSRLAAARVVDHDADGRDEIVAVGHDGVVRCFLRAAPKGELTACGPALQLADPARTLLALGDLLGTGRPQLVALTPKGLLVHPALDAGGFAAQGVRLSRRARWRWRVGAPRFMDLLVDVDRDGRLDVIVPTVGQYELWRNEGPPEGTPGTTRLRKAAAVDTLVRRVRESNTDKLSARLASGFSIPSLRLRDINGDGRRDLVVVERRTRSFHLQREDGTLPEGPDVRLDLDLFRDTTPRAGVRPGRTLAGGDKAKLQVDDLDLDGIPDYLIFHRRKLWVFHGTKEGPQFTRPTAILRVAEDITALLVLHLDDDGRPDLLLVRIHVPTIAAILRGLHSELDVEISASGYGGREGRTFDRTPTWRGSLVLRLPEILGVLRNPESLLGRLEETASKFRATVMADLDGDGREDLAIVTEDGTELELWRDTTRRGSARDETGLRALFFEGGERVWSLDKVLDWLGDLAQRRALSLTGGRDPDRKIPLRDPAKFERIGLETADTDGDGRRELIVSYRDRDPEREGRIDVHRFR